MAEERAQRRLAAILAADVVGYSRLMERDETGTLATLKARQKELLQPTVARHRGRIVKLMGDGVLIEFASAVDAVECAVQLQQVMDTANRNVPEDQRIVLRIGINIGDVMVEGGDLFGDGVNVAARIEGLAEPGGVHVAQVVFDQVRGKVRATFEDTGEHALKNIARPVRVYRLCGADSAKPIGRGSPNLSEMRRRGRPSIAVLPFISLGGDMEQHHLADGISEDIITELARYTSLFVIARNSSFLFREQPVDIRQTGRELGARFIMEGSLRRLGPQIRIAAQLIEVETGGHLWAERFDRKIEDLFALQDGVVRAIVVAVADRIADREDHVLHARQYLTGETYLQAEAPLRRAIELDPGIAEAHALLVYVLLHKYWFLDERRYLDEALASAQRATELNSQGSGPRFALALVNACLGQYEVAGMHFERAITLNPNNAQARLAQAQWLVWGGKCEEALDALESAVPKVSLGPSFYWEARGEILFQLHRYDEAIEAFTKLDRRQYFWVRAFIIAALAQAGRVEEARSHLSSLLGEQPTVTIARVLKVQVYKDEKMLSHLVNGLRMAGMPE